MDQTDVPADETCKRADEIDLYQAITRLPRGVVAVAFRCFVFRSCFVYGDRIVEEEVVGGGLELRDHGFHWFVGEVTVYVDRIRMKERPTFEGDPSLITFILQRYFPIVWLFSPSMRGIRASDADACRSCGLFGQVG